MSVVCVHVHVHAGMRVCYLASAKKHGGVWRHCLCSAVCLAPGCVRRMKVPGLAFVLREAFPHTRALPSFEGPL